ncbi:hypothetical protein BKA81DRAFT_356947 [Phyllosticta paracitricarpa]|uniref:Uncharacterized protein n=1 Tax=Phyllosticta paracitricarpa TaxID=2016321 RepID=A0ABR1N3Z3_9PEZI
MREKSTPSHHHKSITTTTCKRQLSQVPAADADALSVYFCMYKLTLWIRDLVILRVSSLRLFFLSLLVTHVSFFKSSCTIDSSSSRCRTEQRRQAGWELVGASNIFIIIIIIIIIEQINLIAISTI